MKKILPVKLQNDVISFNNYALPLCVIYGDDIKKEWVLEHFGNIYCQVDETGYVMLDYLEQFDYPKDVLEYNFMKYEDYSKVDDIVLHVKERINRQYHLMIIVDNDCLKEKREHPIRHFPMQIYLYGYDDERMLFYGMGYRSDFTFGEVTYGYEEVRHAFLSFQEHYVPEEDWVSMYAEIYMKVKEPGTKFSCSSEKIFKQLRDYSLSKERQDKIRPEFLNGGKNPRFLFGREAQKHAIEGLYRLLEGEFKIDYRTIHLLCEQKKMICQKISWLSERHFLGEDGEKIRKIYQSQVCKKINKARLIFMMQVIEDNGEKQFYAQLKDKETIHKIITFVEEAVEKESEVLKKILGKEK